MVGRDAPVNAPLYRARVLGPFEVERDSEPLGAGDWQHRVQTLFKLLMVTQDRQRRRDDLIDLIWPEADPDTASGNLRILVHRLRLTLGGDPSPVLSRNGWVALNPAYGWVLDLEEMEASVSSAHGDPRRLEAALAMVRGEPFVENRYDDWAVPFTERATRIWREACLQLATTYRLRGRHEDAAVWFGRMLDVDPFDEEALRGLMIATARQGRPPEALKRYEVFRARLAHELDAQPAAETQALVETIRSQLDVQEGDISAPSGGFLGMDPADALVGRDEALERVLLVADAVESGSGRYVMVSGEAGIGKSRFAEEVGLHLRGRGFLLAAARCYSREQAVPFAVFLDVLSQVYVAAPPAARDDVAKRWPELRLFLPSQDRPLLSPVIEESDDQYALFRECAAFLTHVARERPLAILIDDLQWTDDGSLDLLKYLAHETRGYPVFLLSCCRDDELGRDRPVSQTTRDMVRDGVVERVFLGRLGPEDTARLIGSLVEGGQVPIDFSEFAYRRTRGNPLFARKLVRALGGRYRLVAQVGAGGMGRVFEAIDERTGERVALKLMFSRTDLDPRALLRFQQEGALLAGLSHANIVRVRGTFIEEQASYIVMELLEGRSLADLLRGGPLPLGRAKNMGLQILAGLEAAHDHGIVHRDVKPANVMVLDGDQVKVTDFGIARLARRSNDTSLTSTGMTLGTPLYMSPEQVHGDKVDSRTDLYAAGAILYQMVTGRPPFQADDPLTVAFMQVNDPPVPATTLRPGLPADWDALLYRALAKFPADRYQSAIAMGRAVGDLPTAEEEAPREETPTAEHTPLLAPYATVPGPGRGRVLSAVAGFTAVAAIAAAVLAPRLLSTQRALLPLSGPDGVAVDSHGHVYVSDQGHDRIMELSASGKQIAAWGTTGKGPLQFDSPGSIVTSADGMLDVVDAANRRIEVLRGGRPVDEWQWDAGSLALDPRGNLFASDFGNYHIWDFAPGWRLLRTLSVRSINVGPEPFPAQMATDLHGNLYVADREDNRIVKLTPTGHLLARFGTLGTARNVRGRPQFDMPSGVALDRQGRIYVADTRNDRIVVLTPGGTVLRVIPLAGEPVNIAVDGHGNVYCAEYWIGKVVKISARGRAVWASSGA